LNRTVDCMARYVVVLQPLLEQFIGEEP
jgi:hypothetical protein